ncbi:MAG: V-type ATP synthase subunit F, partial [Clostridiales bacterium]|nr:V-type ATP synthase subunit F [Clostridiales bacterium]
MKMYLLSDNVDTVTGMRLSGIMGEVIHEKELLEKALDKVLSDEEIAIIIITEKLAALLPDKIDDIKLNRKFPLVVEIPDRHGLSRPADYITSYV